VIDRLFVALGVRYWVRTESPHVVRAPADQVHASCSAHVARRLATLGLLVEREVEVGSDRSRGWIDLLAFQPRSRTVFVIEVKTEIHDIGAIERSLNWYCRESLHVARRFGWHPARVQSVVLVLQSRINDDGSHQPPRSSKPLSQGEPRSCERSSRDPATGRVASWQWSIRARVGPPGSERRGPTAGALQRPMSTTSMRHDSSNAAAQ